MCQLEVGKSKLAVGKFQLAVGKFQFAVGKFQFAVGKFQFSKVSREVLAEDSILVECRQSWKPGSDTDIGQFQHQLRRLNNPSQTVLLHYSLVFQKQTQRREHPRSPYRIPGG